LQEVVSQLNDYFKGKRTGFELNPQGTDFQKSLGCFTRYPFGKTRTYLEQAKTFR
jgi:methylated-DNA-[protein]-cysteine S-methyltransferase